MITTRCIENMVKKRGSSVFEDNPFIEGFLEWWASPEGETAEDVVDATHELLSGADVDALNRQLIWNDGQRLSITESARRIHEAHPELPLDVIEEHVIGWLEMEFAPKHYSKQQLDELDRLTDAWIDDHNRAR